MFGKTRKTEPQTQRCQGCNTACHEIGNLVGRAQKSEADPHTDEGTELAKGSCRHDPANPQRGDVLFQPLQGERLAHRLVIVIAQRHDEGGGEKAFQRGEIARGHAAKPLHEDGDQSQRLLAEKNQPHDRREGEEAGQFADGLLPANITPRGFDHLNTEIVIAGHPHAE